MRLNKKNINFAILLVAIILVVLLSICLTNIRLYDFLNDLLISALASTIVMLMFFIKEYEEHKYNLTIKIVNFTNTFCKLMKDIYYIETTYKDFSVIIKNKSEKEIENINKIFSKIVNIYDEISNIELKEFKNYIFDYEVYILYSWVIDKNASKIKLTFNNEAMPPRNAKDVAFILYDCMEAVVNIIAEYKNNNIKEIRDYNMVEKFKMIEYLQDILSYKLEEHKYVNVPIYFIDNYSAIIYNFIDKYKYNAPENYLMNNYNIDAGIGVYKLIDVKENKKQLEKMHQLVAEHFKI